MINPLYKKILIKSATNSVIFYIAYISDFSIKIAV
jgi:hypothetical protein